MWDPLCGVAVGGVAATNIGLRWLGVELEAHWADLGRACLEKHRKTWEALGRPLPQIIQGDARGLLELLSPAGQIAGVVSSPPYSDSSGAGHDGMLERTPRRTSGKSLGLGKSQSIMAKTGPTPGQLASLPLGDLKAVISSPPYVSGGHHPDQTGSWGGRQAEKAVGLGTKEVAGYGLTPDQIGRMPEGEISAVVTSPPYNLPFSQDHPGTKGGKRGRDRESEPSRFVRYGDTPGQLEGLPPETYWSAMAQVYAQCHALLPPGGHILLVVKPFVRNKAIIDLPGQTCQLLEAVGFQVLHQHRAWLISKEAQRRFDGGEDRPGHKSFFRRLSERKGAPPINFEVVICAEKQS